MLPVATTNPGWYDTQVNRNKHTVGKMDRRRKQLVYRANHRGIKEMDIVLGGFATAHMAHLTEDEVDAFEALTAHPDRDLLMWFTGEVPAPKEIASPMFDRVLAYQKSLFN